MMRTGTPEDHVRDYYDRNTMKFLHLSRRKSSKAIHQPLYTDPTMTLDEALHTTHRRILSLLPSSRDLFYVVDLGCGIGASMQFLAQHTTPNFCFHGITLSGLQVDQGRKQISSVDLDARIDIHRGSFQDLPDEIPQSGFAYAIESLIHSPDIDTFFAEIASKLLPGGHCVLFDDFLTSHRVAPSRLISRLKTGWLAHTLLRPSEVSAAALNAGLRPLISENLSHLLKINRTRDKLIRLVVPLANAFKGVSQYCRFLVGGDARQRAYQSGLLEYRMLAYMKL